MGHSLQEQFDFRNREYKTMGYESDIEEPHCIGNPEEKGRIEKTSLKI